MIVGPKKRVALRPTTGASQFANSSLKINCFQNGQSSPPYSCGQDTASQFCRPSFLVNSCAKANCASSSGSQSCVTPHPAGSSAWRKSLISPRKVSSSADHAKSICLPLSSWPTEHDAGAWLIPVAYVWVSYSIGEGPWSILRLVDECCTGAEPTPRTSAESAY